VNLTIAILCLVLLPPPELLVVEKLSGQQVVGTLTACNDRVLELQTDSGPQSMRLEEVAVVRRGGRGPEAVVFHSVPVWLYLSDGSRLAGTSIRIDRQQAELVTTGGARITVGHEHLRAVRFGQLDQQSRPQWQRLQQLESDGDLLVVRRGEVLDYHRGTIRTVGATSVEFETAGRLLPVPREKVFGLVFYNTTAAGGDRPFCQVDLRDGTVLAASDLRIADGKLQCTTTAGVALQVEFAQVVRLDFRAGRLVYLSDLQPELVEWTPYFPTRQHLAAVEAFFRPEMDRGWHGGPLLLAGRQYQKGLALHSRSRLVWHLGGEYRRLLATAGIDDRVRPGGSVQLVIRGDGKVLLDRKITGSDPPVPVELDVSGVERLAVEVDFADQFDLGDYLDLCEARLIR